MVVKNADKSHGKICLVKNHLELEQTKVNGATLYRNIDPKFMFRNATTKTNTLPFLFLYSPQPKHKDLPSLKLYNSKRP